MSNKNIFTKQYFAYMTIFYTYKYYKLIYFIKSLTTQTFELLNVLCNSR